MLKWFQDLDRILRGDATRLPDLREGRINVAVGGLTVVLALLGLWAGACVGTFSVVRAGGPFFLQLLSSTLKVPSLFFLTLLVTFPSLYVFNALVGSKLTIVSLLRLLVASMGVTLAVLAASGPIVAFFSVSTTSYPFMVLLNVLAFAIAGMLGLKFLLQTLHRLSLVEHSHNPPASPATEIATPATGLTDLTAPASTSVATPGGALDPLDGHPLGKHVRTVFRCWVIVFGLVGAQMGWVLRPFIGNPDEPFAWFRTRQSNFFQSVAETFLNLFS
jgi:hypothetical protein